MCVGLILLPGYLCLEEQAQLVRVCLNETTGSLGRTNLDTHYVPPADGWWAAYSRDSESVIKPRSRSADTTASTYEFQQKTKRLAVDEEPMTLQAQRSDTREKPDPQPGATVQEATLGELIRKLRWSIVGLEYHVSSCFGLAYSRIIWHG